MTINLEQFCNDYLQYVKATLSDGTYRSYSHHLKAIVKYFIDNDFEPTRKNLINFIEFEKAKNLNNRTINLRCIIFKAMLKYNDYISDIYKVKKLKIIKNHFGFLNEIQINEVRNYILNSNINLDNKLALSLLIDTAVRLRELVNIEWKYIDLDNKSIYLVETKTKETRTVFFTDFSKRLLLQKENKTEKLFKYTEHGAYQIFSRAKKQLNFTSFHPHMLRHSCATNLLKHGADLESVRQILGHTDIKQTQEYLHFDTAFVKSVYDKCIYQEN